MPSGKDAFREASSNKPSTGLSAQASFDNEHMIKVVSEQSGNL